MVAFPSARSSSSETSDQKPVAVFAGRRRIGYEIILSGFLAMRRTFFYQSDILLVHHRREETAGIFAGGSKLQ